MKHLIVPFFFFFFSVTFFVFGQSNDERGLESAPAAEVKSIADAQKTPHAVPVCSEEEAIKANEEALRLYSQKKTIAQTKTINSVAKSETEGKKEPVAVPVLTPEEAIKANKEAIRFQRNKTIDRAFQSFIHKIGLNNNRIHFVLSLLPLLLIIDVLFFKRKKKNADKITEYFSLPRRMRILFSVSLLAFGILVFVPWSVYFGNSLQFPFIFQDFVNWNLRVLTISIIGASIVLLLIPPIVSDYLVAAIAGLGLCVYVQAMFMNQHLGTMDGTEPIWGEHRVFGTINLIVWIAIVLFPVVLRKHVPTYFSKVISMATGFVLLLEVLASASMVFSATQDVWTRTDTYFADGSNQFQLSKKKNVVVFIVDTMGSGFVKLCFEKAPETKEIVKDFIWYEDARSNYNVTFPGLIHELTGTLLPAPANSFYNLFEKMWDSPSAKSFYKQMEEEGYDARLYISVNEFEMGSATNYHDYFSNIDIRDITYKIDFKGLRRCLKLMSGFSFAPYFLKRYFFYAFDFSDNIVQKSINDISSDQSLIPNRNNDFVKKMLTSGITLDAKQPVLSFNYILGCHRPYRFDEKCNEVKKPFDNPLPTTKGCFYIISEYIHLLKEAGIYDNTAILVCSDHGGGAAYSTPYDMTFMIKPFHENKTELSIDKTKVQSIDILPTLLKESCGDNADFKCFDGFSSLNIPTERIRKVYRLAKAEDWPSPDPDFEKCYPGATCLEEYNFTDVKTFEWGTDSESFIRQIPLVTTSEEDK